MLENFKKLPQKTQKILVAGYSNCFQPENSKKEKILEFCSQRFFRKEFWSKN